MENYKDIEIKGRKWRITKFDARTGSYMLVKVMALIAPLFASLDFNALKDVKDPKDVDIKSLNIPGLISGLTSLPEEDFNYIQGKCLGVCKEMLPSGFTDIINQNGTYGVLDVEFDTMLLLSLTAHALIFNVMGFFEGSPLSSLAETISNTFQQNIPM